MAKTRLARIQESLATAILEHDNPTINSRRIERCESLLEALRVELRHTECPRCNQRDVALTVMKIGYRSGLTDSLERICALCLVEVNADREGRSAVYTKR